MRHASLESPPLAQAPATAAVAVDIGGTFTDIIVHDLATDRTRIHKTLSTPENASQAVLDGLADVVDLQRVERLVHGTTVGLNAVLSRTGSSSIFVTTDGFRDLLHLGRAERTEIWRLDYQRPRPLHELTDIHTVRERVGPDGSVLQPLDEASLDPILQRIALEEVTSVAVGLLHACRNPVHELRLRELLRDAFPDLAISLSHEVATEVREYERFSTTSLSAYISDPIRRYLDRLVGTTRERGYQQPLFVMRSSGGVTSAEIARHSPVQTILSGPAGGVVGSEKLARLLDQPNLIAVDMGGTSLDASLVIDGRMSWETRTTLEELPVLMPVVELVTIGAGGGSIAWLEAGGLRVGPQSAGAHPGPVCYGRGGTQPTVTDANVVLGRIDPDYFLGGAMKLDVPGARASVDEIATALGVDLMQAAEGIIDVANARMADALRTLTVRRGYDPRDFSLLIFGGAGPLHGAALAAELEISQVIVPLGTGVFSAWGMLQAPVRHDVAEPLLLPLAQLTRAQLDRRLETLRSRGLKLLSSDGVPDGDGRFTVSADMRYLGQEFFINVEGSFGVEPEIWSESFHTIYEQLHGHCRRDYPVELVNLRLAAFGPEPEALPTAAEPHDEEGRGERELFLDGQMRTAAIYHRDAFVGPERGPLIIEEPASTILVPSAWEARRGAAETIMLTHLR